MPIRGESVADSFIAARNALSIARNSGELGQLEWTKLIIDLRTKMDAAAVGHLSSTEAITYFNNVTQKYLVKEETYGSL